MSVFSRIEISVVFGGAKLQAAVHRLGTMIELGKLSLSFRLENATPFVSFLPMVYYSSIHLEHIGICLSEISLARLTSTEPVQENMLMSAKIEKITVNARIWPDADQSSTTVKLSASLGSILISVGRSLVKMEKFIRDWRRRELASRIVPMYHKILEAWKSEPEAQSTSSAIRIWNLSLEFHLAAIAATFQPIPRLEVIYNLQGLSLTNFQASLRNTQFALNGGIAVDQHTLSFTSNTERIESEPYGSSRRHRGLLKFPSLQMLFSYSNATWSQALHLDLPPLSAKTENPNLMKSEESALQIFAEIMLSGFELSSLLPNLCLASNNTRNMQSFARFVFDLVLSNQSPSWAFTNQTDHDSPREDAVVITADFQRIHAVAATSAFKLLLDCIQYLQFELARIRTVHRTEMAEAESHIEQAWSNAQNQYTTSEPLLQRLIFAGRCSQFGLAIPLDDPPSDSSQDLDVPSPQGFKGAALFISFTQLVTWSRLGQTAQASVELFAIQSVSQLDPSLVEHFESASHETRNAIFVPHLDIRFGLTARPQSATLLAVKASAPSGITIDMSPSILLIIHAFLDVYERDSHLLVNLLESHTQSSDVDASRHERRLTVEPSISLSPTITDPWAIRVDFDTGDGGGGKIQLHTFDLAQDDADFVEILQRANVSLGRINVDVAHSDLFFLPGVSAWAVYNPISATTDAALHVDIVYVESYFVAIRESNVGSCQSACFPEITPRREVHFDQAADTASRNYRFIPSINELSFGLRIDRSELTITCLPTRALAKLQWASGVLFASGRIDKKQFNAACTISKIAAFLRHEHGFDSALKAEAGDMVASLDWRALCPATSQHTHTCSVLLKFSELLTEVTPAAQSKPEHDVGKSPQLSEPNPQNDTTILLMAVLADNIKFLIRLSPSVGTIHLGTTPLNLRVRHIPSVSRSLVLDVGETSGVAVGDGLLGGRVHLQHFTLLVSVEDLSSDTILDINATIGPMEVYFTVSSETILLLRTDLIQGAVQDDWKDIKSLNENPLENSHGRKDLSLRTSLHLRSINVLATLYTASRGKSVLDAIENQVNQQNTQAEDVLSQLPPGMIVRREKDTLLNVAQRLEMNGPARQLTVSMKLRLWALCSSPLATYLLCYLLLSFTTEGCQVARLNLPPNGLSEKIQSDGSWYGVLEKVPTESVLNANRLWISMSASEALEKNQVTHTFRAEMPNNIHISTDVTTHANLWSKFRSAWNKANEVKGRKGTRTLACYTSLGELFQVERKSTQIYLHPSDQTTDNVIDFFEGVYESAFARHQFKKSSLSSRDEHAMCVFLFVFVCN
ncbi:hypothetical protein KEM48_002918 [Puccinia striiformis f. sp. tritici PST-130]|nr:hypothetical protein KEM48_002918 [Puccinia striiformis f. sp. tritici PST-130]